MGSRGQRPKPLADRFWPKVKKAGADECWEWQGCVDHHGYGQIGYGQNSRHIKAHRASWLLAHGELPTLGVLHRCDNPQCVNPAHLFLGDQAANMGDAKAKGRVRAGSEHGMAKLTDADVIAIRSTPGKLKPIAEKFGISDRSVSDIQRGKYWTEAGGPIRAPRRRFFGRKVTELRDGL